MLTERLGRRWRDRLEHTEGLPPRDGADSARPEALRDASSARRRPLDLDRLDLARHGAGDDGCSTDS